MYKTLKEICVEIGVTRRAVQGYEKMGLLTTTKRNKYGHLLYSKEAVEHIRQNKKYQDFGFSLMEITQLVNTTKEKYVEMLSHRLAGLKQEKEAIESYICQINCLINGC